MQGRYPRSVPDQEPSADQLMCEHRWVRDGEDADRLCTACGLGYREYVAGTVRGALSRMGTWD